MSNWENDEQTPGGPSLAKIAEVLGLTVTELTASDSRFQTNVESPKSGKEDFLKNFDALWMHGELTMEEVMARALKLHEEMKRRGLE